LDENSDELLKLMKNKDQEFEKNKNLLKEEIKK
jgi:hypothetical protein